MNTLAPVDPLFKPLRDFVVKLAAVVGIEEGAVIWGDASGPAPASPYVALRINHIVEQGLPQIKALDDAAGTVQVITSITFELQIEVIGGSALALAAQLRSATYRPSLLQASGDWSVALRMPITNVSALLDKTDTQPRAVFALLMQGALLDLDEVGYIENAAGSGTYAPSGMTCGFNVRTED